MTCSSTFLVGYSLKSTFSGDQHDDENSLYATCPRQRSLVFPKKLPVMSSLRQRRPWNINCFERRRMQSVYDTSWSSHELLPSQISPWLMLPPKLIFQGQEDAEDEDEEDIVSKIVYMFYNIKDNNVISFEGDDGAHLQLHNRGGPDEFKGSSHGWLAEFDSATHDLFLYNPISRRRLKLPSMDMLPLRGSPGEGAIDLNDESTEECIVKKVILSSSDPENNESCVAMMLYGSDSRLACCHPARRGAKAGWYPLNSGHWLWSDHGRERSARSYQDIAYSAREKLFFCITNGELELEAWDSMDPLSGDMPICITDYFDNNIGSYPLPIRSEREFYLKNLCRHRERYLVVAEPYELFPSSHQQQHQQLFLVVRHKIRLFEGVYWDDQGKEEAAWDAPLQTVAFDVYKFDVEKRELVYMDHTLDGLALFVGKNHSFAVKAGELDGLKPDSIYFTDSEPQDDPKLMSLPNEYGGHDNGVYNYKDGAFSSCYYPCEAKSYKRMVPAPMWFSPFLYHFN